MRLAAFAQVVLRPRVSRRVTLTAEPSMMANRAWTLPCRSGAQRDRPDERAGATVDPATMKP